MPVVPSPVDGPRGVDLTTTVVVGLGAAAAMKADDHRTLVDLVARLTGADAASVTLSQVCPTCGVSGHGPVRVGVGGRHIQVSLSRADRFLGIAVTGAGPVGVDVESVAALARSPLEDVLCSPAEADALAVLPPHDADAARAVLWTSKEAVLKAAGVGLRVDPRDLTIDRASHTVPSRVAAWASAPFPLDQVHLIPLAAPAGLVGTVAVVGAERPRLLLVAF